MFSDLATRLQALWYRQPPPPWPLRWLALLFGALVRLRQAAYARGWRRRECLRCPVIVVGNLTVGGSGKTPLVLWICDRLRERGWRAGIILRGYGGSAARGRDATRVEPDSDPAVVGDEALLLRRRADVPVAVCRDRVRAGRALEDGVDVIVADDGLQHLRLARDCELVVLDAARGLGNGRLLPAGPLREPVSRLAAVDLIVLNDGAAAHAEPVGAPGMPAWAEPPLRMQLHGTQLLSLDGGTSLPLSSLAGTAVHAVAGIGHPQRFFATLRAAGLIVQPHALPDHHRFAAHDLQFADALPVLMTEKDAVKCRAFAAANRWYLPVVAQFDAADAARLDAQLQRCLARRPAATRP